MLSLLLARLGDEFEKKMMKFEFISTLVVVLSDVETVKQVVPNNQWMLAFPAGGKDQRKLSAGRSAKRANDVII